ncbi:unnamed protein product [Larinioides sclopetarius]|uniref:Uncharacterized protein n=1 Tax=Larinioides sclopetarius TaxID=280406 RepID=A0AAV1YYW3_9ARAC
MRGVGRELLGLWTQHSSYCRRSHSDTPGRLALDQGSGKQILQLWKLKISPDPISFSRNAQVSVQADLYEDIPYGARVHINIWKVTMGFVYVPAP